MGLGQCVEDANGLDFSNRDQTRPETRPMFDARCGFGYEISPRHRRPGALVLQFIRSRVRRLRMRRANHRVLRCMRHN
jgi:hypothetical protein